MTSKLTLAALLAALAAAPVAAQSTNQATGNQATGVSPSDSGTNSVGSGADSSQVRPDDQTSDGRLDGVSAHEADNRPLDQAAAANAGSQSAEVDPANALNQWAQDVLAARQVGYLAADKNMAAGFALLGDQVALTTSTIVQGLTELNRTQNPPLPLASSAEAQKRFDSMDDLNQERFAQEFLGFIRDTYPRLIAHTEHLSGEGDERVRGLASAALPALREQLQTATQLAQGQIDQQTAEGMNRGPIQRKDDPSVIPDRPNTEGAAPVQGQGQSEGTGR